MYTYGLWGYGLSSNLSDASPTRLAHIASLLTHWPGVNISSHKLKVSKMPDRRTRKWVTRQRVAARDLSIAPYATHESGWDTSGSDFVPDASKGDGLSSDDLGYDEDLADDDLGQADSDSVVAIDGDTLCEDNLDLEDLDDIEQESSEFQLENLTLEQDVGGIRDPDTLFDGNVRPPERLLSGSYGCP